MTYFARIFSCPVLANDVLVGLASLTAARSSGGTNCYYDSESP